MEWMLCFFLSIGCLLIVIGLGFLLRYKWREGKRMVTVTKILSTGVVVAAVILFIPVYLYLLRDGKLEQHYNFEETGAIAFLLSVHNTIRLFVVDGDFELIINNVMPSVSWLYRGYVIYFGVLFVAAPLLTFTFALSFFKNLSAYLRYFSFFFRDVYIFSELNDNSLALAQSLQKNGKKTRAFVFTDVFEKDEEKTYEMLEKARELHAAIFKRDIVTIHYGFHKKGTKMNFFAIGADEDENINQALKLSRKMRNRPYTKLYVFSTRADSEVLLGRTFDEAKAEEATDNALKKMLDALEKALDALVKALKKVWKKSAKEAAMHTDDPEFRVYRVNEVRALIAHTLYEKGYECIFKHAKADETGVKQINAVVIGMGLHGTEMTKALAWLCQMDGYEVRIDVFDKDMDAASRFMSQCPDLMRYNGSREAGQPHYLINIHSGVDVSTVLFDSFVEKLPPATYVLVALGTDDQNIAAALKLRIMFERLKRAAVIHAVVYNSGKRKALEEVDSLNKDLTRLEFIGDTESSYSEKVLVQSTLEEEALKCHLRYDKSKSEFWKNDYNYQSSIAAAIHIRMRKECGIPGARTPWGERSDEEHTLLRRLEHRRWMAYMRTEGYRYSGSVDKGSRKDVAKLHNLLVPYDLVPEKDRPQDNF